MPTAAIAAGSVLPSPVGELQSLPAVWVDRAQFANVLAVERGRADRSQRPFCVITLPLRPSTSRRTAEDLRHRLRAFDVLCLTDTQLLVLLPGVQRSEAEAKRSELQDELGRVGILAQSSVLCYDPADPGGSDVFRLFGSPLSWRRRLLDVVVSASMLVALSPILLAAAAAVRLTSPGPVLFRQQRVGVRGRRFAFLKFRSMVVNADSLKESLRARSETTGPIFKIRNDPRMTRVGRLLRKTSIDELPQLWHVLVGDMTLVGPRPPTPDEVQWYQGWQMRRLEMVPGITCIWQVSGRSNIGFEEWMRLDVRYQQTRNWRMDLGLMFRTVSAVVSQRGAC